MAKIYFVRHQAHGVVAEFPFSVEPSQDQVAAVAKWCFQHHGFGHKKNPGEPYWTKVVEFDVLGVNDLPVVPERKLGVAGEAGAAVASVGEYVVSGTGHVTDGRA